MVLYWEKLEMNTATKRETKLLADSFETHVLPTRGTLLIERDDAITLRRWIVGNSHALVVAFVRSLDAALKALKGKTKVSQRPANHVEAKKRKSTQVFEATNLSHHMPPNHLALLNQQTPIRDRAWRYSKQLT